MLLHETDKQTSLLSGFDSLPMHLDPPALLNNIPPELLSQIFLTYLNILLPRNSRIGLVNLCLTCRHWKEIIYNTAELWAYVGIRVKANSDRSLINAIDTWLKRSLQHPLKISFTIEGYNRLLHTSFTLLVEPIVALICEEIHRWSRVSFSLGLYSFMNPPTSEERTAAPILETLEVNMTGYHPLNCTWLAQLMHRSPNLRTFRGDIPPRETSSAENFPIPFSRLSTIDISSALPSSTALTIIDSMPSLTVCRISLESDGGGVIGTNKPPGHLITCYAHELRLGVKGHCRSFLDPLLAPNLERLDLHFLHHKVVPMSQENPLHDFLRKTASTLSSFTIRNLFITDSDLLTCLQILSPRLKSLRILSEQLTPLQFYAVENFTDLVISALHYDTEQPLADVLCPALEVLTLQRCVLSEDGLLSKMIASRWNVYASQQGQPRFCGLYFFEVVFRYHVNLEDRRVLEELRRQGLGGQTRYGIP